METRLTFLLSLLQILIGCDDSDSAALNISESELNNISAGGESLTVDITYSSSWTVINNKQWYIPNTQKGENGGRLVLSINANLESDSRTVAVTTISHKVNKVAQIIQNSFINTAEEHHYETPVIFHILYKGNRSSLRKINSSCLSHILDKVDSLYKSRNNGVDANLTLTLATTDKNGEALPNPDVEYIQWSESQPIDYETSTGDNSREYVKYLWDPNSYINIMVYSSATESNSNSVALSISHIPFSTKGKHYLEGFGETDYSHLTLANSQFPLCVSVSSLCINEESTSTKYNTADVTVALAHELGHYLGPHHVFAETSNDTCEDTDCCKNIKGCSKQEYDSNCGYIYENERAKYTLENLVKRTGRDGIEFISHNTMDYITSHSNQFTQDQCGHIRHVLSYSPLIPGPKKGDINAWALNEDPLDLLI